MSQIKRLQTIDADTLQSTAYEPVSFVIDDLLPQGLHLLAGAPKIGKSWLALWLCLCATQGKPLWTFATRPCEVLYLCLEDSFQRIQSRLFDLTEDAPPTLHFAVMSQQLHNGLVEQIEQFLKEHPQTRLIVIDTLQRIRTVGNDANPLCQRLPGHWRSESAGGHPRHRHSAGASPAEEVAHRDAEIAGRDEQAAGTDWEPERAVFLQVDRLAPGFQPAGGPQVDHAGADPWHGGTGGVVWRGSDPQPVPLIPAAAGLAAAGTLLDEDEDVEEKRRRMEAKIAAENFGAAVGFVAGAALAVKEKMDEHAAREGQKGNQHEQTMGGF